MFRTSLTTEKKEIIVFLYGLYRSEEFGVLEEEG
jgi:hypothetical protein